MKLSAVTTEQAVQDYENMLKGNYPEQKTRKDQIKND